MAAAAVGTITMAVIDGRQVVRQVAGGRGGTCMRITATFDGGCGTGGAAAPRTARPGPVVAAAGVM